MKKILYCLLIFSCFISLVFADPDLSPNITLDLKEVDARDVFRAISTQKELNVVVDDNVQGKVTLHLSDATVKEAFQVILELLNAEMEIEGNILKIKPKGEEKIEPVKNIEIKLREDNKIDVNLNNASAEEVFKELSDKTGENIVLSSEVTGSVKLDLKGIEFNTLLNVIADLVSAKIKREDNIYKVIPYSKEEKKESEFDVEIKDGRLSLNVQDIDISELLRTIADKSGFDLILLGSVKEKVNVKLTDVELDTALNLILRGTRFGIRIEDNLVTIGENLPAAPSAPVIGQTSVIRLSYIKSEEIPSLLPPTIPAQSLKVLKEQNSIAFRGTDEQIKELEEFVHTIDIKPPVVMLDMLIVDYLDNVDKNINFSSTLGTGENQITETLRGDQAGFITANVIRSTWKTIDDQFAITLQALIDENKAEVKAEPRISTVSGQEAKIRVENEEYFRVTTGNVETPLTQLEKVTSGISLTITPYVASGNNSITVKINATVSQPTGTTGDNLPAIKSREASTQLVVDDGQTIVIGGLLQSVQSTSVQRFPILSSIPVVGLLFKNTTKQDRKSNLVFYITPTIVK
ncbi:MAG: type II and III secretion system protein [Candidatus Hydrogenedentota bacterium]